MRLRDGGYAARQSRVRVLEEIDRRIRTFRPRDALWPLRAPREPLLLEPLIERALPGPAGHFDLPALRSRTLLALEWEDGSAWEAWVITLPSGLRAYCDSGGDETRVLASGGRNEGDESDRAFLALLCESAGAHFGIEMAGGAPSRVRSSITDRAFLAGLFVDLFEVTGAEASVRAQLPDGRVQAGDGIDFRADVEAWLDRAIGRARSTQGGERPRR